MTNHTGHAHPATKAARAACRRASVHPTIKVNYPLIMLAQPPVLLSHAETKTKHSFFVMRPGAGSVKDIKWVTKTAGPMGDWFTSTTIQFS